jgi:hypothetical protein
MQPPYQEAPGADRAAKLVRLFAGVFWPSSRSWADAMRRPLHEFDAVYGTNVAVRKHDENTKYTSQLAGS